MSSLRARGACLVAEQRQKLVRLHLACLNFVHHPVQQAKQHLAKRRPWTAVVNMIVIEHSQPDLHYNKVCSNTEGREREPLNFAAS